MKRFGERKVLRLLGTAMVALVALAAAATASASHPTLAHSSTFDTGPPGRSTRLHIVLSVFLI